MILHVSLPQWVVEHYIPRWYFTSPSLNELLSVTYPDDISRLRTLRPPPRVWSRIDTAAAPTVYDRRSPRRSDVLWKRYNRLSNCRNTSSMWSLTVYLLGENSLFHQGSHLPVRHSYNVAVHPMNTGLVYHPLHRRDEHLAPLKAETLLGRKLLGEKLLKSGGKPNDVVLLSAKLGHSPRPGGAVNLSVPQTTNIKWDSTFSVVVRMLPQIYCLSDSLNILFNFNFRVRFILMWPDHYLVDRTRRAISVRLSSLVIDMMPGVSKRFFIQSHCSRLLMNMNSTPMWLQ